MEDFIQEIILSLFLNLEANRNNNRDRDETMHNDDNSSSSEDNSPIRVSDHLEHVATYQGRNVTFQCQVTKVNGTGRWFHNGVEIPHSSDLTHIQVTGKWHRLIIPRVHCNDQGLYYFVCKKEDSSCSSQACLFVELPMWPLLSGSGGAVYLPGSSMAVTRHLKNTTVLSGDDLTLQAGITVPGHKQIRHCWFKNNSELTECCMNFIETARSANMMASYAKRKVQYLDSGFYTLVVFSTEALVSSMCEVVVKRKKNRSSLENEDPCFIELLKEEIEVGAAEMIVLTCKVAETKNLVVTWYKDDRKQSDSPTCKIDFYGNRTYVMQLLNLTLTDTGNYSVVLKNTRTGVHVRSHCFLTVLAPPEIINCNPGQSLVNVIDPLHNITTSFGTQVVLHCSFELPDDRLYYVVWYVGACRIKRSTHNFQVVNCNNHFLLYILNVIPDTIGVIRCTLRRRYPGLRTLLMASTAALMVQVPLCFFRNYVVGSNSFMRGETVYIEFDLERCATKRTAAVRRVTVDPKEQGQDPCECAARPDLPRPVPERAFERTSPRNPRAVIKWCFEYDRDYYLQIEPIHLSPGKEAMPDVLMDLIYCRLHRDGPNFVAVKNCGATETSIDVTAQDGPEHVIIRWQNRNSFTADTWYRIEVLQDDGIGILLVGFTSEPTFCIENPVIEQVMWFRIKAFSAPEVMVSAKITIRPAELQAIRRRWAPHLPALDRFEETDRRRMRHQFLGPEQRARAAYLVIAANRMNEGRGQAPPEDGAAQRQ